MEKTKTYNTAKVLHLCFLIIATIVFSSCNRQLASAYKHRTGADTYVQNTQPNITIHNCSMPFDISSGYILISSVVNGTNDTLIFDTGFNGEVLQRKDKQFLNKDSCRVIYVNAHYKSRQRQYIKPILNSYLTNQLMTISDFTVNEYYLEQTCSDLTYSLLGNKPLKNRILTLDFDNQKIGLYDTDSLVDYGGYTKAYAVLDSLTGFFFVYITVDGEKKLMLFDTGAPDNAFTIKEYRYCKDDRVLYGKLFDDLNQSKVKDKLIIGKRNLSIDEANHNITRVSYSEIRRNVLGLAFISQYNWILDYKNARVYYRKAVNSRYNGADTDFDTVKNRVTTVDGKLEVCLNQKEQKRKYKLYKQIESVDGQNVTDSNICHFKQLLNSESWDNHTVKLR
ncbi:MAG: hypothetical protein IJ250_06730 [Bacteroidales bacterium]|nr:hypothetical protein [Bacteroidales bacterium]